MGPPILYRLTSGATWGTSLESCGLSFFPPFGLNEEPFWLHDYWCVHKTGQRRKADYLLREAIEAQQLLILPHPAEQPNSLSRIWTALVMIVAVLMFLIQRWAIWSAVRLFAIIARKK